MSHLLFILDTELGTKLKDNKCAKDKDRLTVSINTKRTSDEAVSNKDSASDKSASEMRYNRIFKKTSQVRRRISKSTIVIVN